MATSVHPIPIEEVINALLDVDHPFPTQYLHVFSDISSANLSEVKKNWNEIANRKKVNLLLDLESLMEADTLLAFDAIARFALKDEDPNVRSQAIALLWECEEPSLADELAHLLKYDPSEMVQGAAAAALGRFILLGELDEIPQKTAQYVRGLLLGELSSQPGKKLQQEIVKSLAYANIPEIEEMISVKFDDPDHSWRLTSIIAMGRSADERWEKPILKMLKSPNLMHQIAAVRSAGELELEDARKPLMKLLNTRIQDDDLRIQIIWSLSKIGGEDVRETLERLLENTESQEECEIIEMALDHLAFNDELPSLDIF